MNNANSPVLDCFWLPHTHHHVCISGANQYTIKRYRNNKYGDEYSQDYFQRVTLPSLRNNVIPYPASMKRLPKSKEYCNGFREVVNDALHEIYGGRRGFVFTTDQLIEILKFVPDVEIVRNDGIYYVKKKRK